MTPEETAEAILRSCAKDDDGQPIVERWRLAENIRAAVAEEREACAQVAEQSAVCACRDVIAKDIRARGAR